MSYFRGRRLRKTQYIRDLVQESCISATDLIQPYFVVESTSSSFERPISSMPGQSQFSIDMLLARLENMVKIGLRAIILFGIPIVKDEFGSQAYAENGIVQKAVRAVKAEFPQLVVITDVCLCEFTSHGHCGLVKNEYVQNDITLPLLAKIALSHAQAGADIVAPSDMMDGRVQAIRSILDKNGFEELPIMSYAVKYSSAFYGPFRDAAESAPKFGDRKSYQMNPSNSREAIREAMADIEEGADILIVKPGMPYLDIVRQVYDATNATIAAYQVSGEFAMIKAAAKNGWIEEKQSIMETLLCFKRAGASLIISYFTEDFLRWSK